MELSIPASSFILPAHRRQSVANAAANNVKLLIAGMHVSPPDILRTTLEAIMTVHCRGKQSYMIS